MGQVLGEPKLSSLETSLSAGDRRGLGTQGHLLLLDTSLGAGGHSAGVEAVPSRSLGYTCPDEVAVTVPPAPFTISESS